MLNDHPNEAPRAARRKTQEQGQSRPRWMTHEGKHPTTNSSRKRSNAKRGGLDDSKEVAERRGEGGGKGRAARSPIGRAVDRRFNRFPRTPFLVPVISFWG